MLLGFLKSVLGKGAQSPRPEEIAASIDNWFVEAGEHFTAGRIEEALAGYQRIFKLDPHHVVAMNQVALCLSRMQRNDEAGVYFERAALIDDSFAPALVNFAIHLNDAHQSGLAETYLAKAQKIVPNDPYLDGVLGAVKMLRGRPHEASAQQLGGWLKEFENFEFAHSFLFNVCYPSDTTAQRISAEHFFWAETLAESTLVSEEGAAELASLAELGGRKVRIGYISADFRVHSVRYFFRPLLENHDRNRFELFGYYDMTYRDAQTDAIEPHFDHFRTIANQPDTEVFRRIREDRLDILVELTGHTSRTRIHLMRQRLAPLHITAIGYPPTTGLRGIDYKLVDGRTAPVGTESLYAERLMRLPTSFWCFNPLQETPDPAPPPAVHKGYVTFGCFGNISKISRRVLSCWAAIMRDLPDCRLVLKAITFKDEDAKTSIQRWLDAADIDLSRVELVPPDTPEQLFAAYADIDIVLDTHPFNGGTTSCFALWMSVPFVTLEGDALISRMGASMLHTLGLPELIARTDDEYVRAAVALARDLPRLIEVRGGLRQRMLATPLGNGALFAREFEQACEKALVDRRDGADELPLPDPPVLEEKELVRRAQFVKDHGQLDAAMRIVDFALRHYPKSTGSLLVKSGVLELSGRMQQARDILYETAQAMPEGDDRRGVEVNLARLDLLLGQYAEVTKRTDRLLTTPLDDLGRLHVELYAQAAHSWMQSPTEARAQAANNGQIPFVSVVVHCEDDDRFSEVEANLAHVMLPGRYDCIRVDGESRASAYNRAAAGARGGVLLFMRASTQILSSQFHSLLSRAIELSDVVGCAGSSRLAGPRWFDSGFPDSRGAVVLPNGGPVGGMNLSVYGPSRDGWSGGLTVLDDALFAVRKSALQKVVFDASFDGDHGLCEADWFVRAKQAGFSLGASPRLGIARLEFPQYSGRSWHEGSALFRERHGLGDLGESRPLAGASVLLPSLDHAMPVIWNYYTDR
jgi:predicted O-linked N-acetylglucosamine transferase (SPINDLY family)